MARRSYPSLNPWKLVAIGMAVIFATALITGVVVARYVGSADSAQQLASDASAPTNPDPQQAAVANAGPARQDLASPPPAQPPPAIHAPENRMPRRPSSADIEHCNRVASSSSDTTSDTIKDALIGGAVGAGLGAAGGAIAGGGSGAGKGAGVGSLVGAATGTVFGLSQASQHDAQAEARYRSCMRRRGYQD